MLPFRRHGHNPIDCSGNLRALPHSVHVKSACGSSERHRQNHRCRHGAGQLAHAWPHVWRAALQPTHQGQYRHRGSAWPGLDLRDEDQSRRVGDAPCRRRCHVRHLRVEPRICPRCGDGPGAMGLRPEGRSSGWPQSLLRRRQSRRRRLRGQGVCRRHRRPPGGPRREERFCRLGDGDGRSVAAVHHHRRPARRQRPRLHRQRRRGIRRPRLRLRL